MPYRQKGSPYWYISYTSAGGRRVKESSGETSHAEAKTLEARKRLEVHRQLKWGEAPRRSYDELMAAYLRATSDKASHDRDLYSATRLTARFTGKTIARVGDTPVSTDITAEDVAGYKAARLAEPVRPRSTVPPTKATVAKELFLLSGAIAYANAQWDWKLENPVTGRVPVGKRKMPRWLRREGEAPKLLEACADGRGAAKNETPLVLDYAELGFATGMRSGEMLWLEWPRVDFGARLVYFDVDDQKGQVPGSIPLNDWALEVLRRRLRFRNQHCPRSSWVFCKPDGKRVASLKHAFGNAARRAGLLRVTPHALRHSFAAWLVQAKVPLRTVCELMRHKDIRTTMIYAHLAPENTREAIALLGRIQAEKGQPLSVAGSSGLKLA